ncbi:MAG: OmpA family protein [Bacteroidota bacterium]
MAALQKERFSIGTREYLQVQQLLESLPETTTTTDLMTLLAPVLVTSPQEQERFYDLFKESVKKVERLMGTSAAVEQEISKSKLETWCDRYLPQIITVLMLVFLGIVARQFFDTQHKSLKYNQRGIPLFLGDSPMGMPFRDTLINEPIVIDTNICPEKSGIHVQVEFDKSKDSFFLQPLSIGVDTLCLMVRGGDEADITDTVLYFLHVVEKPAIETVAAGTIDTLTIVKPPRDELQAPKVAGWRTWLANNQEWIKIMVMLLLAGVLYWLVRRRQRQKQKFVIDHQPNTNPPYVWNAAQGSEPEVQLNEAFFRLLHTLRQRTRDDVWRFNAPKTVHATIRKGGRVSFVYEQQTRPAEYLLLIDRHSNRNHRARLFDYLFQKIKTSEVYIERYFFDGDLRLCWNENTPNGIFLKELQHRYVNSRLLLVSDGYRLLNPKNGRLARWTKMLEGWKERALLTPVPMSKWKRKERVLNELFHIKPANVNGLISTILHFETGEAVKTNNLNDKDSQPYYLQGNLLDRLYFHFAEKDDAGRVIGDRFLQWIAACAVYPQVNWELTLHFGKLLSDEEEDLLTLPNLQRFARLPWFVSGHMAQEVRRVLVHWLEQKYPELLLEIRRYLLHLLDQNPPPTDSVAYDEHRMQFSLNEWMLTTSKKRKKELQREIAALIEQGHEADFIAVKVLESEKTFIDQEVPESWLDRLRANKIFKQSWVDFVGAGLCWLLLLVIILPLNLDVPQCSENPFYFEQEEWCLDTPQKKLWAKEFEAYRFMENRNYPALDSVIRSVHLLWQTDNTLDTAAFYQNMAKAFHNRGGGFYNLQFDIDEILNDPGRLINQPAINSDDFIVSILLNGRFSILVPAEIRPNAPGIEESDFLQQVKQEARDSGCYWLGRAVELQSLLDSSHVNPAIISSAGSYCLSAPPVAGNDCVVINLPSGGRMFLRNRPLTRNELRVVNDPQREEEAKKIDNQTVIGAVRNGDQAILLDSIDSFYKIRLVSSDNSEGQEGFMAISYKGTPTLFRAPCPDASDGVSSAGQPVNGVDSEAYQKYFERGMELMKIQEYEGAKNQFVAALATASNEEEISLADSLILVVDEERLNNLFLRQNAIRDSISRVEGSRTNVIIREEIFFKIGMYALPESAKDKLAKIAETMNSNSGYTLSIYGYASTEGDSRMNYELSRQRALSCGVYIIDLGVSESRIEIAAFGETTSNNSNEVNPSNRRVVLEIMSQ